jgi:hemolysin D
MSFKHRVAAYAELIHRYHSIFVHFWQYRETLGGKLLTEHEAEFLPAALSLQAKPVSPTARLLAMILMLLVGALMAWSIIGKIDIIVNASGKIIPSGYTKTIASVDVASVKALFVEEGQPVKQGDLLIELDTSASDAERDKAAGDQSVALLQVARAKALIAAIDNGHPPKFPMVQHVSADKWQTERLHLEGEYNDFIAKLKRIEGDIAHYSETLPLAAQRADDYKALLAAGWSRCRLS